MYVKIVVENEFHSIEEARKVGIHYRPVRFKDGVERSDILPDLVLTLDGKESPPIPHEAQDEASVEVYLLNDEGHTIDRISNH